MIILQLQYFGRHKHGYIQVRFQVYIIQRVDDERSKLGDLPSAGEAASRRVEDDEQGEQSSP